MIKYDHQHHVKHLASMMITSACRDGAKSPRNQPDTDEYCFLEKWFCNNDDNGTMMIMLMT